MKKLDKDTIDFDAFGAGQEKWLLRYDSIFRIQRKEGLDGRVQVKTWLPISIDIQIDVVITKYTTWCILIGVPRGSL